MLASSTKESNVTVVSGIVVDLVVRLDVSSVKRPEEIWQERLVVKLAERP
jgi:hypothetical protein